MKQTLTLQIKVSYDDEVTNPEELTEFADTLLQSACSDAHAALSNGFGNPEFGHFEYIDDRPKFIRVEYDLDYTGGDYSRVGHFAFIPLASVQAYRHEDDGLERAFEEATGHNRLHIINYSEDELYVKQGHQFVLIES